MDIQTARLQVAALLIQLSHEFGYSLPGDASSCSIELCDFPPDQRQHTGIRVSEVTILRPVPGGGITGSTSFQAHAGGLQLCAAVERALLARVVGTDASTLGDADDILRQVFFDATLAGHPSRLHPVRTKATADYIASGGTKCPFCGSYDITGGSVEIDAGIAWQEVSCSGCEKTWRDDYSLVGFTETD